MLDLITILQIFWGIFEGLISSRSVILVLGIFYGAIGFTLLGLYVDYKEGKDEIIKAFIDG